MDKTIKFLRKLKPVLNFVKNYWLGLIFLFITIFVIIKVGFMVTLGVSTYGCAIFIYFIMKNNTANMIIRKILKMTRTENEQKQKRKNNHYGKKAEKESFKVKKFNFNK